MDWTTGTPTMGDGPFIHIRVPRFAVLAIRPTAAATTAASDTYTTPHLGPLRRAIAEWRITETAQPKRELLVAWFREQEIEGEAVSENRKAVVSPNVSTPVSLSA